MRIKYWFKRIVYLLANNQLISTIKSHKNSKQERSSKFIVPRVSIETLTDTNDPLLKETEFTEGNISIYELKCIAKVVQFYQPKSIFEIGTFDGRTTLNMALNAPQAKIFTLDLPNNKVFKTRYRIKTGDLKFIKKDISGSRFIGTDSEKRITQIYADSANFDYKDYVNNIDLVFIDGSHTYDYVVSDTKTALKLLRNKKGIILWHDYGWQEVNKALSEFYSSGGIYANMKNINDTSLVILQIS